MLYVNIYLMDQNEVPQPTSGNKAFAFKRPDFLSNKTVIIVLSVLLFLTLIGTAVTLFLIQNQTQNQSLPIPSQEEVTANIDQPDVISSAPTKTPKMLAEETATWNTFINSKYHYSIKYPIEWTVQKRGQLEPKIPDFVVFNPPDAATTSAIIRISYSLRTFDESKALNSQFGQPIVVASRSGVRKVLQDSNNDISINVILPYSQNSIILFSKEKYSEVFTQMLSTFKIL
jgi:hypothetical protein